jgi:hypothetical protein
MRSVGVTSIWAAAAAAVFATVNVAFGARFGHTALSSHFLLLWALALHFDSLRARRATVLEWTVLLGITLLVNSYLFVMVCVLELATLLALWFRKQLSFVDARASALGALLVALVGVCAGYGSFLIDPSTMKSQGFGLYSWNLVGLLLPPDGVFGWLDSLPRAGTHGQYEGESYIGRGALLFAAVALVLTPRKVLGSIRTYWVYVTTLVLFAIYAASNLVYLGDVLVLSYDLPPFAIDLANYFRATGRFIWPLAYSLALLPIACVFRWLPRPFAVVLAISGIFLQYVEGRPALDYRRVVTSQAYEDLIDAPRFDSWLAAHQRVWQYPSWWCGGLAGPSRVWGRPSANLELQTQLAAARRGLPTNSVYTSRALKDCEAEKSWVASADVVEGTLYLLSPEAVRIEPRLAELARSDACTTLEWAVVCSKKWERMASGER